MSLIRLEKVTKVYEMGSETVHALRGIDLTIDRGEFVAIMGPSGSGKSTLMHILGLLDRPTRGAFFFDDEAVEAFTDRQLSQARNRRIGFVFQSFNLLPQLDVRHNVELPLIYSQVHGRHRREHSGRRLEEVGLADRMGHLPNELSGGQRQRVAIARALVNDPPVIMADEPTGNLDTKTGRDIMSLLYDIHRQGTTIILVTHEREIAEHCQRVVHIRDGLIENIETLKEREPSHV